MKRCVISKYAMVLSFLLLSACQGAGSSKNDFTLDSEHAKFSYSLGLDMGYSIAQFGSEVNEAALYAGISARLAGKEPIIDESEQAKVKQAVFKRLAKQRAREARVVAEKEQIVQKQAALRGTSE